MCEPWYIVWEQDKAQSKIYWTLEGEGFMQPSHYTAHTGI